MTKKTTHEEEYNETGILYVAFELGVSEWKLGFTTGFGQSARRRAIRGGDLDGLMEEIAAAKERFRMKGNVRVVSCYEAGRDGFWLHRFLVQQGVGNVVVDSSSIEVNRRKRRAKSDGLDVVKLLTMLMRYHLGEEKVWSVVRVPTVADEDRRQLHRELKTLKKEQLRTSNRVRGLLASVGVRIKGRMRLTEGELERVRLWDGSKLLPGLKSRLKRDLEHLKLLRGQILTVEKERGQALRSSPEPQIGKVKELARLRGIGECGGWVLAQEFFGWREFRNGREVGSLAGLTPTPYQSGEENREQGILKAGNRHVRSMAIELAWCWVRYQPQSKLTRWFRERFGGAGKRSRRIGIVAVARRLLVALWRFLDKGILPEGAELKA